MLVFVRKDKKKASRFYSFTQISNYLRDEILTKQEQDELARRALKLLDASHLEFDLIEYYKNIFNHYLNCEACSNS